MVGRTPINREKKVSLEFTRLKENEYIEVNDNNLQLVTMKRNKVTKEILIYAPAQLDSQSLKALVQNTSVRRGNITDFVRSAAGLLDAVADVTGLAYSVPMGIFR